MIRFLLQRLALAVPTLLCVSFLIFCLQALLPGDAATALAGGNNASLEQVEQIRQELGLDDPFLEQYMRWLGGAVHLDFGTSLTSQRPVSEELAERIPVSVGLAIVVFAIAIPFAWLIGIICGLRPGSIRDRSLLFFTSVAISAPAFWVGLMLVTVFAVILGWLPPFGLPPFTEDPAGWLKSVIMPAVALALASMAALARQVRAGLAGTMQTSYIRTAWAKGGSPRQVVVGHALKNSAIPAVTVLGLQVGALLSGTVIIEKIFNIPGLGSYMLDAVNTRDVPVIQAVTLVFVVANVLANLCTDAAYGFLNPKVRV